MRRPTTILLAGLVCLLNFQAIATAIEQPLKVYILAGQSNMQGHAQVRTFDHFGMNPKTAPILKEMRTAESRP